MISFPNVKINIGLNIVEKRADGFHNIESVFYPLPLSDILEIIPASETLFTCSGLNIPGDPAQNLCIKAFRMLQKDFDLPHVHIHLHKIVPIGAGLGGGSADAAFTLKMLNERFSLALSSTVLENYAKSLGSDCAFFIDNKPKYCFKKGDEFSAVALDMSKNFIVVVYPNIHISTPEAYSGVVPQAPQRPIVDLIQTPISSWKESVVNDFETSIFKKYPVLSSIKDALYHKGALYASMSGSGSSLFGIFEKEIDISDLETQYWTWSTLKA